MSKKRKLTAEEKNRYYCPACVDAIYEKVFDSKRHISYYDAYCPYVRCRYKDHFEDVKRHIEIA